MSTAGYEAKARSKRREPDGMHPVLIAYTDDDDHKGYDPARQLLAQGYKLQEGSDNGATFVMELPEVEFRARRKKEEDTAVARLKGTVVTRPVETSDGVHTERLEEKPQSADEFFGTDPVT